MDATPPLELLANTGQSHAHTVTLAGVLAAIPTWTDLPSARRRDLASAVRGAAAVIGTAPTAIPASCRHLNARLFQDEPEVVGLGGRRFSNIVSGLRFCLRRLGLHAVERRGTGGLSPAWTSILDGVRHFDRLALARFTRWADDHGLVPEAIGDDAFRRFGSSVVENEIGAAVPTMARKAARVWNRCIAGPCGLPTVSVDGVKRPYVFPLEAYPKGFQEDVGRYFDRIGGGTRDGVSSPTFAPFTSGEVHRPRKPARAATLKTRQFQLRMAAAALVQGGMDPSALRSLRDLVEPLERPHSIIQAYYERGGSKQGAQVGGIAELLRQIAKYHVRLPDADVQRLAAWAATVSNRGRAGLTAKNRTRLQAMLTPHGRAKLLHLPSTLMRLAAAEADPRRAARFAEIAAMIEILLICPLRLSNLVNLRVDENLRRHSADGRQITHLVVDAADVKNATEIDWPLPSESVRLITRYLARYRPTLAAPDNLFLFPGRKENARSTGSLAGAVVRTVAREAGLRINTHLFRHFAAHLFLQHHPAEYETVRRLLGHRSIETTMTFYCGLEANAAARRVDETVLAERKRTRGLALALRAQRPGR